MSLVHQSQRPFLESLPVYTDDPVDRLLHTLGVFRTLHDDHMLVRATTGYGLIIGHDVTGLTIGDLRQIAEVLGQEGCITSPVTPLTCIGSREIEYGKFTRCWNLAVIGSEICWVCTALRKRAEP